MVRGGGALLEGRCLVQDRTFQQEVPRSKPADCIGAQKAHVCILAQGGRCIAGPVGTGCDWGLGGVRAEGFRGVFCCGSDVGVKEQLWHVL